MKKLFFIIVTLWAAPYCFSQTIAGWNLELSGGYLSYSLQHKNEYTINNGFPVGLSANFFLIENFGMGISWNYIHIPKTISTDTNEVVAIRYGGDDVLVGTDFLLNFIFIAYNNGSLKVPVTIGAHIYAFAMNAKIEYPASSTGKADMEYYEVNCGLGLSIGIEYHFNKRVYMAGRIQGIFDFISSYETILTTRGLIWSPPTKEKRLIFINAWGISPQLGIGIKF